MCWSALSFLVAPMASIFPTMIVGITTALVVGYVLRGWIKRLRGWRWFALPLLSIAIATMTFGLLLPPVWWLVDLRPQGLGIDSEAFWKTPLMFGFFSLTVYIWLMYPASLLTHYLLRRYVLTQKSNRVAGGH
jgi:hypothetical protein